MYIFLASPIWKIEPQDTTVLYHQSIVVDCQAAGYPEPRITWTKAKGNFRISFNNNSRNYELITQGNSISE